MKPPPNDTDQSRHPLLMFYECLANWLSGAYVKRSYGAIRIRGDAVMRPDVGMPLALRHDGVVMYARPGIMNPCTASLNFLPHVRRALHGSHQHSTSQYIAFPVNAHNGGWRRVTHSRQWQVPAGTGLKIHPVTAPMLEALLNHGVTTAEVERATSDEHARLQRMISACAVRLGHPRGVSHTGAYVMECGGDVPNAWHTYQVGVPALNALRARFQITPLPELDSPIPGVSATDFRNLSQLAALAR